MSLPEQIKAYIESLPEAKSVEMQELHNRISEIMPDCKQWFLDGKDESGKVVSNPNVGYGSQIMKYADGKTKEFYQIGISANTSGISVYIMGLADKNYLPQTYGKEIGKATVTGYCIKFKKLKDINPEVLDAAILSGVEQTNA